MKELVIVMIGSGVGGGMRYLVSKGMSLVVATPFPLGTFTVNILGCLLIGFFSSLPSTHGWLTPQVRLLLTTGFCGGFTTFSTFMKESDGILAAHFPITLIAYLALSLAFGMVAVWGGSQLAKTVL